MSRLSRLSPDLRRLLLATLFFGAAGGVFASTLNNYLSDVHRFGAEDRGWLELPRELPGFLIFLVSAALLTRMRESRMAVVAMALTALGSAGLGLLAPTTALVVVWVAIWSLGDHIIFAVEGPLGLALAKDGREGRRLGQLGGARNLGTIAGVGAVFGLAQLVGDRYDIFYAFAAVAAVAAGVFYFRLAAGRDAVRSRRLVWRKEYGIFYAISALFGIRKQIFLVFGSWVLVSIHEVALSTIALLYFIASCLGIVLRPLMGEIIDWLGERTVLAGDTLILLFICLTYAFASHLIPAPFDLWVLFGAYVLDNLLFALRVARTTYLKKIARDPADITPTISLGITIDHAVAMSLPVLSGFLWEAFGFEWVFLLAGAIALAGFFVCLKIRVPVPGPGRNFAPRPGYNP
ncbi:MAG: MFS transporter [Planctomycetes bacterium]|jgi:predicted MFS family arabinose efflux permease|nr:MFS transporter [Planctomycetota bacterium]